MNVEKKSLASYLKKKPHQKQKKMPWSDDAKQRHQEKKLRNENARKRAGVSFLNTTFDKQVQEVVEFIDGLEPKIGCVKKFPARNSFEFIRCGFQKFILEYDLQKRVKYPNTLDELNGR